LFYLCEWIEMKFFIFIFIIPLLIVTGYFLSMELLNTYNTQKDREMFVKTYEIVIECRKSYTVGHSANSICGEVPVFYNEVK
jgi:S-ribosylhomocysteine lyase LuxS involved in autoinducer biosynthesis